MPTSRLYITSLKNLLFASLERRGSTARDCELSWLILFDLLKKVPLAELTVANRVKALHELQLPPGSTAGYIAKPAEWLLAARRVEQFFHDFSLAENEVLLQGYLLALKARGCSRSTIKNYLSDIRQLLTFATDATITDVLTETRLLDFSRGQERVGLASSTIRRKLTTAAQFAKWLADEHGIESAVAVALGNLALNYGLEGGVRAGSAKQTLSVIPDSIIDSPSANQGTTGKPITEEKSIDSISTPINYRPASLVGVTHSKSAPTTLPDSSVPLAVTADTHQRSVAATPQSGPTRAQVAQGAKSRRSRFPKVTAQTALTSLALIISALGFGLFARSQFLTDPNTSFAYPANLTRPARTLSFQGRLTDSGQNPVTSATNMTFRLMDSGPSTSGGSELWSGINCSVDPDQDGIFSVGLGDECGAEIDADVFSENANVWLQVEVGAEVLSPRQSIKSVAYALNSETLQGYPASASATESTVVVMNSAGQIVLGNSSPVIKATSTNGLSIEGRSLNLITTTGSNGNITLDPDGIGQILAKSNLQVDGAATVGGILRTQKSLQVDQYATVGASLSVGYNTAPAGPGNAVFSGNVGIGTTNPGALFHIEKSSAGAGIGAFIHNSAASTLGNSAELGFGTWTNEYGGAPGGKISLINTNAGSGANAFTFFTKNTSGVVAERVRFDSQGNVGIGTTNPGAKLDIGTAGSSLGTLRLAGNTSGYVQIQPSAAAGSWTLTLPTGAGTNNFVLATNGSGVTSWVDPAALAAGTIYWTQTLGTIQPKNTTVDLLVGGTATSSAKAAFLNINSGTPTASVSAGTAGGAFLTATGNLSTTARQNLTLGNSTAFNTTGNILLNPNGTGNVGVGTTNPGYVLDVQATTGAMNLGSTTGTNYSYLTINNTGGYFRLGRENSAGGGLLAGSSPYASVLATQGTYPLQFGVNNALAMTILNGGNVGIGTTTPGSYKLNVNGKIYAATQGTAVGEVLTAGRTINTTGPLSGGGALTGDLTLSCPTCVTSSSFTGFANPSATIGLTAVNGSATTAMRSDAAPALSQAIVPTWTGTHTFSNATYSALFTGGNVGIGVTNPSTLLNIAGGLTTTGAVMTLSTNEPTVVANDVLGSINFNAPLQTGGGDGILTGASIAAVATGTFSTTVNSTALQFRTGNSEAATTKMTIAANGNVGIGTTSPDFALQVNGVIAPETTDQDLGTTSLRWDLLANTINADSTVTLTGLGTGTDNTVVILNSSNQLTTDEIDAKVWGTGLVDTASGTTNYVTKWTSGGETIGNSIIFDNGTNVGIGTASPVSKLDITTNSLGVAQTNASGVVLANTTAAAAGAQQISPAVRFRGQGWKTNATAGSQPVDFRMFVLPVQGTANPSGSFILQSDINASGTYTNRFVVGSNGTVTIPAMTTAGIVMNDASGNLSGGNTISSSNITTGSLVQGTGMSLSGTLTNRLVDSGSVTVGLAGQALALHNLATNGIIVRTGAGTVAARTITGTANQVIVTNGSGVSGDPTLSLPQNIHTSATPQFARLGLGAAANGTYHLNLNGALLHGTSTGLGIGTTSPGARLDVTNAGSNTFALIVGSDLGAETRTNATRKFVRVGMPHYTNAEEPVSLITGDSDGTNNIVTVGGGTGIGNASTSIQFNTAANASTVTGTTRMTIASNGAVNIANLSASLPVKTDASKNLISGAINLASSTEVTGTLPINRGGTNTTATPTAGGITYGTGTAYAFTSAGTAGQALLSGGAGAPTFGTLGLTYGGTNANLSGVATGGLIYKAASALAGTGALTGVLKGNGSSAPTAMTGITNYVTRWTDANTLGTGVLFDNGTNVGVGTATPTALFDVASGGSSLFKVSPAQIESAVPHLFSAAGDVSMAYDLIFTNQTAAGIESYGPFTIKAGEAFESNNLTLKTYNSGKLIIDSSNIWADGTNVGIGTTTPGAKLEVAGQVKITGGAPGVNKVLTSDATGLASWTDLSGIGVTSVTGTANQITASPTTGAVVLTLPSDLRAPGTFNAVTSIATGAGAGTVRIDASGNLTNIGTIAATGAVTIGGTEVISTGRLIKAANGAVGTPAFSFSADTNTGMYSGGTDILRLATAGTDRLTILANGNVGIGTTSPGNYKLNVAGGIFASSISGLPRKSFSFNYSNTVNYYLIAKLPATHSGTGDALMIETTGIENSISGKGKLKVAVGQRDGLWYRKSYDGGNPRIHVVVYKQADNTSNVYVYLPSPSYTSGEVLYYQYGWTNGVTLYDDPVASATAPSGTLIFDSNNDVTYPVNDPISVGNITAGTYNSQTISSAASFTGTIAFATLGTANTGTVLCRNSSNQLAGCSSITATSLPFSGLTSATNTSAAMVVGSGASLNYTGTGTINASSLEGLASSQFGRSFGTQAFTSSTTTADFITELTSKGLLGYGLSSAKGSWSYAGNSDIADTGFGAFELAGTSLLTWNDGATRTILAVRPTTGAGGGQILVYNDQGSGYSPGWRQIWTNTTDGSGSGLDADLLDGWNLTTASTVSTVVGRDASGDINARLFRSEYDTTNATIGYIMTQIDTVSNNYIRPSTPAQLVTGLGLEAGGSRDIWVEKAGDTMTGTLILPAATTSLSPLRIPHGTAHSSPTNGDLWTTTAGLYARINGATVGPYSATTGTVTSVGLSMPSIFTVSGSPVTTSGTLTATLANQNANIVFAGPTTGAATTPTFRSLVDNDIPDTITLSNITQITTRPHSSLTGLTSGDDHTQYALLAGRSGGQTLIGGTATTDDLILRTTSGVGATGADMIFQVGNNGATEAMRILNNGNVGIGTVSPGAKLALTTHTTAAGGILFGTDTNLYRSAANTLRTDDNLSIGTLATGATNTVITHSSGVLQARTADAKIWGTGLVDTASGTTNYVTKWTSGGETIGNSIIFDNGTNVGIGTATPVSKLDVTTTALGVTQTNASGLLLANTTAAAAGAQQISPAVRWSGRGWKTAATAASQSVDFRSYVVPVQGTANPTGYLTFESSINGGAYVSGLNLASNGNVGIGTTAPTSKLEVTGNIVRSGSSNIFSSTTDYDNVKAQVVSLAHNTAITAGTYEYIGTDVIVTKSGADSSTGTLDVFGVKSAVQYLPSDNAFGATRRTYGGQFLAAGNTLGTSTAFGIVAKAELADLNYGVYASGSTYGVYSNGKFHFNTSGGGYGNYVCSSSSGTGTLGSCSSSIRYKENVADMDLGLNVVLAMDPKTFSWKYNGQSDYGFIAEDLERINPQLVFYNEEGQVEGVKYDRLTGVLANAMQEQQAQIEGIATSLSGQDVTFDDGGSLLIADSNGSYSVTSSGSTLSTIIAGAEVIGGTVRAGLVSAREISVSGVSQLGSLAVSGATQLSTLTVSGLTQLSSLTVSGFTQLANLTVTGSTNLASLTATGASTLASVSASSLSLTTDSLSIAGQSLRGYIESVVNQMQLNNAIALPEGSVIDELAVNSLSTEELATADLSASGAATINTADITNLSVAENATIAGKLEVASDATINGELNTNTLLTELLQADTTLLGSLLTETATVLGDATVSGSLAVSGDITSSGSARLQALESKLAEFEKIQATTAELFTASVSGTLYANHIADLDRLMAESVAPTFLQQLIGYDPLATDSARVISQITGVDLSETLVLDPIGLGELATESVLIGADAGFFKQYLQVNGNSALGGDVTIAGDLRMNQGLTISSNEIAYAPVLPESCTPVEGVITDPLVADSCRQLHTLKIQSSGAGALDLMNGLVVLADGTVTITGNVTFTQNITVQDTLLTDLISPTSFDKPIQLQVAGVSTESGEVQQSRFEIVNELGTPVATISAQGNADFAGKASFGEGVAIASQDLTTQVATIAGQLSSTKTSGKAKVVAGTSQIIITNSNVTEDSLIYVTPVGSTGNQTLYVKQQTGDDPLTAEVNEASFTVGTDFPLVSDATFNWWVVN